MRRQRAGGEDPIAADAAGVRDRDVGAGVRADRVDDEIAEVGFRRADAAAVGVERHARRADDGVERRAQPLFVRRDDRGCLRIVGERVGLGISS